MTFIAASLESGYDDTGTGEPALLCIPGWCGDRSVFAGLTAGLGANRRTLAMDLPEHGTRPRTGADLRTDDVVRDAQTLLDAEQIERVVPVALSHAGWAAIELRRRLGADRVPGIVLLDWMVLGPPPGFVDALAGLQDPTAWADVRSGLFAMWTTGLDIPALDRYVDGMGEYGAAYWHCAGREISTAFAAEGTPLAALERLDEPCPTLHLYAQPADDAVLAAQQDYAAAHPWFRAHRLPARSHFPMFEVPGEMNTVIEDFACGLS
ncbi:alpha/beta fold hydrolase [uncultured Jatrophihabitans sp.]|uniref:alpha/beta fold hydrolase n=1 Tax=uncultured Jatrophihabitans sp. TaxID=1610747 RepID=UPI0035CC0C64